MCIRFQESMLENRVITILCRQVKQHTYRYTESKILPITQTFMILFCRSVFRNDYQNTIWHLSPTSDGIWHSTCRLHMCIHIQPLKCRYISRSDLNRDSNHRNLNICGFFFFIKMTINWLRTVKIYGGKQSSKMQIVSQKKINDCYSTICRLFLFASTAAGVVQCGGRKTSPHTSTIVQLIF